MSSSRSSSQKPTESSQFIRPTSKLDTASAAERLALKGAGLASSDEVAAAIREGVATKLADAMMAALGNRFECLSSEDVRTLAKFYTSAPGAVTMMADAVVMLTTQAASVESSKIADGSVTVAKVNPGQVNRRIAHAFQSGQRIVNPVWSGLEMTE